MRGYTKTDHASQVQETTKIISACGWSLRVTKQAKVALATKFPIYLRRLQVMTPFRGAFLMMLRQFSIVSSVSTFVFLAQHDIPTHGCFLPQIGEYGDSGSHVQG